VSSQDLSPASYPLYAGRGSGEPYTLPQPRTRERYWLHSALFALTLLTTTMVGASMQIAFDRNVPFDLDQSLASYGMFWRHPAMLLQGLPFSLALLTILLAHEFGHYIASTWHRVDSSLPYFMPSPFFGTFGAFIKVRSPIYSKRALFDIGIAGPLAGFEFLLPALSVGLAFSKVIPGIANQGSIRFGVPFLQLLLERAIFPGVPAANIYLHPVARAAWVGIFATSLNLLPIGQLDGGHILYSFFPRRHRIISRALCIVLIPLGPLFWLGWLLWGLILFFVLRHPPIYDEADLGAGRRKLGWIALAVFLLCFILDPISAGGL
jgi:membrane-associated protease RseP (regulator of RpoE activity)